VKRPLLEASIEGVDGLLVAQRQQPTALEGLATLGALWNNHNAPFCRLNLRLRSGRQYRPGGSRNRTMGTAPCRA
jgi:hypothetical protein